MVYGRPWSQERKPKRHHVCVLTMFDCNRKFGFDCAKTSDLGVLNYVIVLKRKGESSLFTLVSFLFPFRF